MVDAGDPAFARPTKPIGPTYDHDTAKRLAPRARLVDCCRWRRYRRVVPSPEPRSIVELQAIRLLIESGVLVVCVGGGGIPVILDEERALRGVEAVIDKDLASTLLASELEADALLMLTMYHTWRLTGARHAHPLTDVTVQELRMMNFAPGSMAPKVEAACRFVEQTGGLAAIGALQDALALLRGERGTRVIGAHPASKTSARPSRPRNQ